MVSYCENRRAIAWLNDTGRHARTKHYDIELEWLRERHKLIFEIRHIGTDKQQADLFTKALPMPRFQQLSAPLGLCSR